MRIPKRLLTITATIRPHLGPGAYGPIYGEPYTVKCHAILKKTVLRPVIMSETLGRQEVAIAGTLFISPDDEILPESQVTLFDTTYTAIEVKPKLSPVGGHHHTEVILGG